jgi:hypothetical protein
VVPEELPQQVPPLLFRFLRGLTNRSSPRLHFAPAQLGTRWRTPDEAGQDVVHLVTQPATGPRGKLLQEGKEQPW